MKDNCSGDARPNGNNCALPPIWNNTQGEHHQGSQYGDFDKGFHRQNMRPTAALFQPGRLSGGHGRF